MQRPKQKPKREALGSRERKALSKRATYVGSPEHKEKKWWGGLPEIRYDKTGKPSRPKKQHTTPCPLITPHDKEKATKWVREAIASGQYTFKDGDGEFPKRIWHVVNGKKWAGLIVNPAKGEYKGWPLEDGE